MSYIAKAVSRVNLRELALWIRKTVGYEYKPYFPIVKFMEHVMPEMFPGFNYEIVDDDELPNMEGLTIPRDNLILLPNRVYEDAAAGKGRARFSVSHEVSHYIIIDDSSIALARSDNILPYQNPEWQANALTSEILLPPHLTAGMSQDRIAAVFGVSNAAANVHIKQKKRENLP